MLQRNLKFYSSLENKEDLKQQWDLAKVDQRQQESYSKEKGETLLINSQ